jgi:hypothetical protein
MRLISSVFSQVKISDFPLLSSKFHFTRSEVGLLIIYSSSSSLLNIRSISSTEARSSYLNLNTSSIFDDLISFFK